MAQKKFNTNEGQRKDGRYYYKYRWPGETKWRYLYSMRLNESDRLPKGARPCKALRTLEDELKVKIESAKEQAATVEKNEPTLNDRFDRYIETICDDDSESTVANYKSIYNKYIRNGIGKEKIADIKNEDIDSLYRNIINGKTPFSNRPIKVESLGTLDNILRPVFASALKNKYITENPVLDVLSDIKGKGKKKRGKNRRGPADEDVQEIIHKSLTVDQESAFLKFCFSCPDVNITHRNIITTMLFTGLRVGEMASLTERDCEFSEKGRGIIHVNSTYSCIRTEKGLPCDKRITSPKTDAGIRQIPMFKQARKALLSQIKLNSENKTIPSVLLDKKTGFLFTDKDGFPISTATVNSFLNRYVKMYNAQECVCAETEKREPVLLPHISSHWLRHTFCTRFCETSARVDVIVAVMGHSDAKTTLKIYNFVHGKKKNEAAAEAESNMLKNDFSGIFFPELGEEESAEIAENPSSSLASETDPFASILDFKYA